MTILAVLLYALTGVALACLVMFMPPALWREAFQVQMSDLAQEVDDRIRDGSLPHHAFIREFRDFTYYFAEHPGEARLRNVIVILRDVREDQIPLNPDHDDFIRTASPAELYIANELGQKATDAVVRQSLRNSVLWLPLAILLPVMGRLGSSRVATARETLIKSAQPGRAHVPLLAGHGMTV